MQLGFRRPRKFRLGPWIQVPRRSRHSLGDRNSALSLEYLHVHDCTKFSTAVMPVLVVPVEPQPSKFYFY